MTAEFNINSMFREAVDGAAAKSIPLNDYLELCKSDEMAYAGAPQRLLKAIGEPERVDTSKDQRLSRIFNNRTILRYPSFSEFYGMEEVIERVVAFVRHAAQGLEERKQILYLLGPVGGGKSSIAERLKELMQVYPIYTVRINGETSPVFDKALAIFATMTDESKQAIADRYNIDVNEMNVVQSPWLVKRLEQIDDINKVEIVRLTPSKLKQVAIMKTEPGDDNNQDISALVGKVDIRKLEKHQQNDTDAYSYSGGLNRSNQGLLEFVEMFKAPIKVLHPLLTATQEGNYIGTENIGAIPFSGMVLAHSNESEWETFKNNKNNEAFLDRVYIVKVPYCVRVTEEELIYKKMIAAAKLRSAPCAPETLRMAARFSVLTRLKKPENSEIYSKLRVYDGEHIKEEDPKSLGVAEYRDAAGVDEGMTGSSTREMFKILSATFNYDVDEVAADPVHFMAVLEDSIRRSQLPKETEDRYLAFIAEHLVKEYAVRIGEEIQKAYIESYDDYGQNIFDRYIAYADHWLQEIDYKDPDTDKMFNRERLNSEMEKIETAAGIVAAKDFRSDVNAFVLRQKAKGGRVLWTDYEKMRRVIEKKMFKETDELLPVISFGTKENKEFDKKHTDFVDRMVKKGYTKKQVKTLVDWYLQVKSAG